MNAYYNNMQDKIGMHWAVSLSPKKHLVNKMKNCLHLT